MEEKIIEFLNNNQTYTKEFIKSITLKEIKEIKVLNRKQAIEKHNIDSCRIRFGAYVV